MPTTTIVDFSKDSVVYNITGITQDELETKLNLFFSSEGYKYKGEKAGIKTYTKGNLALRIILGAFWKYFKISVTVRSEGNLYSVMLRREASGIGGGVIGMQQVKKEFTRVTDGFKTYFS